MAHATFSAACLLTTVDRRPLSRPPPDCIARTVRSRTQVGLVPPRVVATDAARAHIRRLMVEHGRLMFHQSGGCCDGSAPMCFVDGEFRIGGQDVFLGDIEGNPVYIGGAQFELWQHTQLILDLVPGRGAGFSLEAPDGVRFLTRGRVFTDEEVAALAPVRRGGG